MTKPIGQTFFINEPIGGVEGVVLTAVDIYFAQVSKTYGIELQIRQTDNGSPTPYQLPNGSKTLQIADTYPSNARWTTNNAVIATGTPIIQASADASIPTTFVFDTPVFLQSQTSYALMLIPVGGNPDYNVWIGEINKQDVSSKTPIQTNNDTGTLFLSSNDLQYTAVQSEDIKFTIYTADFSPAGGSGQAVFVPFNEENVIYDQLSGSFTPNEFCFVSNNNFYLSLLNISSNTAAFTTGENIYQSNGIANVAAGTVLFANTSVIKVSNTSGTFVTSYQVQGGTSTANAVVSSVNSNVMCYSNTTLTVPFTNTSPGSNIFYANQTLYVGKSDRSFMDILVVNNVVNATTITVKSITTSSFTENDALLGDIRGDAMSLYGRYSGPVADNILPSDSSVACFLWDSQANSTQNFANSIGRFMVGLSSKASAIVKGVVDLPYNAVVPQFAINQSQSTNIDFSFTGIDKSDSVDGAAFDLTNHVEREMTDKTRLFKSRSNEIVNNSGAYETKIYGAVQTANNKFSPYFDKIQSYTTFTYNSVAANDTIYGYRAQIKGTNYPIIGGPINGEYVQQLNGTGIISINISANTGAFTASELIYQRANTSNATQNTAVGTLYYANSSVVQVINTEASRGLWTNTAQIAGATSSSNGTVSTVTNTLVTGRLIKANSSVYYIAGATGKFAPGYKIYASANTQKFTYCKKVDDFGEKYTENVFLYQSRYISKSVILADKQDSEDLICYLTAYRPANTNFRIYAKLLSAQDPQSFSNVYWSRMPETSSPALLSSKSNPDDMLELTYSLPTSQLMATNSSSCNTTSANVTVLTTTGYSNNSYMYIHDTSTNKFNVRKVLYVANNTTLVLSSIPSFTSSNADIGLIPGLEDVTCAFHYDQNNNIMRYVSNTDVVYDSFKTFAIKIVPVADDPSLVPRAADMRTIALQV